MMQCLVGESLFLMKGSMLCSINKQMKESTSELWYSSIYHILISYSKATDVLFWMFYLQNLKALKGTISWKNIN